MPVITDKAWYVLVVPITRITDTFFLICINLVF